MNKALSLAMLVAGVVLLVFGLIEADSIRSSFSRLFTGEPTDKSVWLLIGGWMASVVGLSGLARSSELALYDRV